MSLKEMLLLSAAVEVTNEHKNCSLQMLKLVEEQILKHLIHAFFFIVAFVVFRTLKTMHLLSSLQSHVHVRVINAACCAHLISNSTKMAARCANATILVITSGAPKAMLAQ